MLSGNLWPVHPQPLPDELLSSWLIRSAKGNKQKLQNFTTLAVADLEVWWRDIDKSASLRLLLPLSFKSGVSVERLYRATLWSYAGRLYAEHDPSNSNRWTLRVGHIRRRSRRYGLQYCPLCLAQEPLYFRRIWRLAFVTVCPEHDTPLRDHCPSCDAPIAPYKVDVGAHTESRVPSGIPINRCYECGADLSAVEVSHLEKADTSVSAFQAHLLSVLDAGSVTLSDDGDLSSVAYFDGLRILVTTLMGLRYTRPFSTYVAQRVGLGHVDFDLKATSNDFEYQPSEHRHIVMTMLAWLMEGWPERFIQAYAQTGMTQPKLLSIWSEVPAWLEAAISKAHTARIRFEEEHRALLGPYRDLSERNRSDLRDFLEHGADRMDIASERVVDLKRLIGRGYLTTLDSSSGELVLLTTRGRSALGVNQGYSTSSAAAGHVIRRRAREMLEARGWTYIQKEGPSLISLCSSEGKKYYLLCGHGKYGRVIVARRVRTLKERLREENAVLMVVSEEPEKLMGMQAVKEGWVEVFGVARVTKQG